MAFADGQAAIEARMTANWSHADVMVIFANDADQTLPYDDGTPLALVRFDVQAGVERPVTRGAPGRNTFRQSGEIIARVLVPSGSGRTVARGYADEIAAIFRDQIFSDVHCTSGASVSGGDAASEDGNYYQLDVIVPFFFHFTA